MCSHKQLRISREGLRKEDLDSCSKEILTLRNGKSSSKRLKKIREIWAKSIMRIVF
jgi:hypothetical protein